MKRFVLLFLAVGLTLGLLASCDLWDMIMGGGGGGRNQAPSMPTLMAPADKASGVLLRPSLTWSPATDPDGDAVSYDVYCATANPPNFKMKSTSANYFVVASDLSPNTKYYWCVVALDGNGGETTSLIWYFTTGGAVTGDLSAPLDPAPSDAATGVNTTISILNWSDSVCDNGELPTYDLYLADSALPVSPTATGLASSQWSIPADTLLAGKTYHWKVVAKDADHGSVEGGEWTFATAPAGTITTVTISGTITAKAGHSVPAGEDLIVGLIDYVPSAWESDPTWADVPGNPVHTTSGDSVTYSFAEVPAGSYMVVAWVELHANALWDTDEPSGCFPAWGATSGSLQDFQITTSDADMEIEYVGTVPVYYETFTGIPDLALAGWLRSVNTTGTVEVIADPTLTARGNVLELNDQISSNADGGAVVYSPAVPALTTANLTTGHSQVTISFDFYFAGDVGRWFVMGKTRNETFVMNDPDGMVDAYTATHRYITVERNKWYTLKLQVNQSSGSYDVYVLDGATQTGFLDNVPFNAADNYEVSHLGTANASDGRLMFGSWFSYPDCPNNSYGHLYVDNIMVVDGIQ